MYWLGVLSAAVALNPVSLGCFAPPTACHKQLLAERGMSYSCEEVCTDSRVAQTVPRWGKTSVLCLLKGWAQGVGVAPSFSLTSRLSSG